jgi:polysaccharide export outer membrane protein
MPSQARRRILDLAAGFCERCQSARKSSRLNFGLLLSACALVCGCQTTFHRPLFYGGGSQGVPVAAAQSEHRFTLPFRRSTQPPTVMASAEVLHPQSVVYWSALPGGGPSTRGYQGRSTVKQDGNIDLGPCGSVHVAGLTPEQARMAIAKQVAQQIRTPRVTVSLAPPPDQGQAVAHKESSRQTVVRTAHTTGPSLNDNPAPQAEQRIAFTGRHDEPPTTIEPPPAVPELPGLPHGPAPHLGIPGRAPNELSMVPLAPLVIGVSDILLIETRDLLQGKTKQEIRGQHLVNPDGAVHLGLYGSVRVAGLTLEQARQVIAEYLRTNFDKEFDASKLNVDFLAYNSKRVYVITDGGGYGEQVYTFPVTGDQTVLDALSYIGGLPPVSSKMHVWVARRNPGNGYASVLPVNWIGTTQRGEGPTNYQIFPGDRVYVRADCWRTFDANVQKVLSPFERILGATLLGASAVQEIRGSRGGSGSSTGR